MKARDFDIKNYDMDNITKRLVIEDLEAYVEEFKSRFGKAFKNSSGYYRFSNSFEFKISYEKLPKNVQQIVLLKLRKSIKKRKLNQLKAIQKNVSYVIRYSMMIICIKN